MAKYLKLLMVALFATMTFTFTSCGDDDEDEPSSGNQIEINGKKWTVDNSYTIMGMWMDTGFSSFAQFQIAVKNGNRYDQYIFQCEDCPQMPKDGDDFAKIGTLTMGPEILDTNYYMEHFNYSSGSAIIKSTDKSKERMTIQFNNLKMTLNDESFTFNGTVVIPWNFD